MLSIKIREIYTIFGNMDNLWDPYLDIGHYKKLLIPEFM